MSTRRALHKVDSTQLNELEGVVVVTPVHSISHTEVLFSSAHSFYSHTHSHSVAHSHTHTHLSLYTLTYSHTPSLLFQTHYSHTHSFTAQDLPHLSPPTDSEDSSVVQRPLCHQPHSTCRYSQGPFSPSLISNKATQQQEFPTSDSEYSVVQRGASPVSLPSTDDGDYSVVQGPFSPSLTSNKEYPIVQQESPTNNTDYSVVQRGSSQHSLPPINDDEEYSALRQEPPSHLPFSTNDYSVLQQESPTFSPLPTNNAGYSFVQQVPHSNTRYSKLSIVHKHPSLDQQHNYEDIEEIQRKRGDGTNEEADASV